MLIKALSAALNVTKMITEMSAGQDKSSVYKQTPEKRRLGRALYWESTGGFEMIGLCMVSGASTIIEHRTVLGGSTGVALNLSQGEELAVLTREVEQKAVLAELHCDVCLQ